MLIAWGHTYAVCETFLRYTPDRISEIKTNFVNRFWKEGNLVSDSKGSIAF